MLNYDIQFVKGVGPARAKKLNKLDIYNVEELLSYYPVKYEDRRFISKIRDLEDNKKALLKIKIFGPLTKSGYGKKTVLKAAGKDETGFISLIFFNQDYLKDKLNQEDWFCVYGNVKVSLGKFEMVSPEIEKADKDYKAGRIMPVYGLTKGLSNNELTKIVKKSIEMFYREIEDVMPVKIKNEYGLISRREAIKHIHFPADGKKYSNAKKTLSFEKLIIMNLGFLSIKSRLKNNASGIEMNDTHMAEKVINSLPFGLTGAQKKAMQEIKDDMSLTRPMNRMLQGDVGSGKTIVAIYAMLVAVNSGFQATLMAPTEILARQHYETIKEYLNKSCINVNSAFLSGSTKTNERKKILQELEEGSIDILIGTHALTEEKVIFKNIGLVITDEQHRFGVRQRALLSAKGKNPHILVMTATPIPRTLALTIYGDLDISVIDELPPGRQTVKTCIADGSKKEEAYDFIIDNIKKGKQAYIVAPLIEESEGAALDSAQEVYNQLKDSYFHGYKLGLLHGKMKNDQKEKIISEFYAGKIDVLVSTTVIEVGINVPNAVIMMVLNSERFGLAQLHQLRGRVGRGESQSYCIYVNESKSKKSKDRMNVLKKTNDGFIIAEEDLRLRGPGDFFGTSQHGLSKLEIQSIVSDVNVVRDALTAAKKILNDNPLLEGYEYKNLKEAIINLFSDENIVFN